MYERLDIRIIQCGKKILHHLIIRIPWFYICSVPKKKRYEKASLILSFFLLMLSTSDGKSWGFNFLTKNKLEHMDYPLSNYE